VFLGREWSFGGILILFDAITHYCDIAYPLCCCNLQRIVGQREQRWLLGLEGRRSFFLPEVYEVLEER